MAHFLVLVGHGATGPDALFALGVSLAHRSDTHFVAVCVPDATLGPMRHGLGRNEDAGRAQALLDVAFHRDAPVPEVQALFRDHAVYRVDERRLKTYPRNWADGESTPGLVLISPVVRAAALDAAAFDAHWRDRHGPLALAHHVGMWDYRQAVVTECLTEGAPSFDGIARLGFPTVEAFENGFFDSKEGRRALGRDTALFVDVGRTLAIVAREIVLKS
jgi:uncharacterized protein (TIGR02118 family)